MMVCPYDESRLLLVLQIDHSRVAGLLAAHRGNKDFAAPNPYANQEDFLVRYYKAGRITIHYRLHAA